MDFSWRRRKLLYLEMDEEMKIKYRIIEQGSGFVPQYCNNNIDMWSNMRVGGHWATVEAAKEEIDKYDKEQAAKQPNVVWESGPAFGRGNNQ